MCKDAHSCGVTLICISLLQGEDRMPMYHPKDRRAQGFIDMFLPVGTGLVTRDSVEDS